jgi:hypothetical protein
VVGAAAGRAYTPAVATVPSTAHVAAINRTAPSSSPTVKRKALVYDSSEHQPFPKVTRTV